MAETLRVPELGENVDSVEVVNVLVTVGDEVEVDRPLVEVETEKASVEIPSTAAGTVTEVHAKVGAQLKSGDPILTLEVAAAAESAPEPVPVPVPETKPPQPEAPPVEAEAPGDRDRDRTPPPAPEPDRVIPASPSIRRFAREVGVDLARVKGSGPRGRLTMEDVKRAAREGLAAAAATPAGPVQQPPMPDFSRWGEVTVEPMTKIRRLTAEQMARAAALVPQVTHHDQADVTDVEAFRKRYAPRVEKAGGALTVTAILVKVVATALRSHPKLNASIDMAAGHVVFKRFVNVGVAVDTEHGLLVPVVRDADSKSLTEIALALSDLASRARSRKLMPDEMQGATFTVSNLGGIGGSAFSPIVNWPEVGILGVSRARMQPTWDGETFRPRLTMPLDLSYDHRLVDGADAARFLRFVCEALEQPLLLTLES